MSLLATIRVVVVDDHELVRQGIVQTLERYGQFALVAAVGNGKAGVAVCAEAHPDVLVLDICLPDLNGLDVMRAVQEVSPQTSVVVLSMEESDAVIDAALTGGVKGYLFKSDAARELPRAIEAVAAGKPFFTGRIFEKLLQSYCQRVDGSSVDAAEARLTPREREIVRLVADGQTNKEIANELCISVRTVETHRKNVMEKIGAHSAAEVVLYAIRTGIRGR